MAAGTPARPEEVPTAPVPSLSPVVETPVAAVPSPASSAMPTAPVIAREKPAVAESKLAASPARAEAPVAAAKAPIAVASATPATVLAPARVREWSQPSWSRKLDSQTFLVGGLVLAGIGLLAWVIVPEVRRRGIHMPAFRRAAPATGPRLEHVSATAAAPMQKQMKVAPRLTGGPRQVSLKLKASEPSLRRAVVPIGRPSRAFGGAPVSEPVFEPNGGSEVETAPVPEFESVGPVVEQWAAPAAPEMPAVSEPAELVSPIPTAFAAPAVDVAEPVFAQASPVVEPETEPIGQGQPIPELTPVTAAESSVIEVIEPKRQPAGLEEFRETVEIPSFAPQTVSIEPLISEPTTPVTMPEPIQIPTAQVRTPGGTPQPAGTMQTSVQLSFAFEIASMQLTPTFKMGALQLRPVSKVVTMRLAPSAHPQPAMNLQVNFEIAKIQPAGGTLGSIRLTPSQQQRPTVVGSPSFTVGGLHLVSDFAAAPLQLTPSQQGQASVNVTAPFQIATVEFSPSFEIASIILNSNSKQVSVQLPSASGVPVEGAPIFEIANLQLTGSGDIGMMQLNLLGHGPKRAA